MSLTRKLFLFFLFLILLTSPIFLFNKKTKINWQYSLAEITQPVPRLKERVDTQQILNQVSASSLLVIDEPSLSVLLEKNATSSGLPASTTKLMTALVARENYNLDQIFEVQPADLVNGNHVGFQLGEKINFKNLLHALLINSSNDAAQILANHHPDGYTGFVRLMNAKAKQLGLEKTFFDNPSGLDNKYLTTSARDLAILTHAFLQDDILANIVQTKEEIIYNQNQTLKHYLYNTHELLHSDSRVVGVKTGTTDQAGEVLITKLKNNEREILIIILNSQDRYADTRQIIDWVLDNYDWLDIHIENLLD